jgi:hypothetical protein
MMIISILLFAIVILSNNSGDAGTIANTTQTPTTSSAPHKLESAAPPLPFEDGFENAVTVKDIFPVDLSRWHSITIQSNSDIKTVNEMQKRVLLGTGDVPSDGNRVEITQEKVHSGKNSLKLYTLATNGTNASKASIKRHALGLKKGDQVYFSGWYYLVGGTDASLIFLWDLEASPSSFLYKGSPGRRIYIQENGSLASDLGKWMPKTVVFRPAKNNMVTFPKDRWVNLKVHVFLSEANDGVMEVWIDDAKVLDGKGQTLPEASTTYESLEVGLTANGNKKNAQTLYIDDIKLSTTPIF